MFAADFFGGFFLCKDLNFEASVNNPNIFSELNKYVYFLTATPDVPYNLTYLPEI